MAFAELKRLKAKIRQGSATTEEIEKYREMMPDHNDESDDSEARSHHHDYQRRQEQEQRHQVVPPVNENGSRNHPLPVRLEAPDAKRQRLMVINPCHAGVAGGQLQKDGANKLGGPGPGLVGQGRSSSTHPPQPTYSDHGSSLALLDALRASKATRGHHQLSKTMFRSVVDQLKSNPQDEEGVRAARRLTGMKGTAAIMSPSAPFALSSATGMGPGSVVCRLSSPSSCNASTNMSAQHILRRIGNPHRRVVHQMLREQNERILCEMKRQTIESMSRPSSSGAVSAVSAVSASPTTVAARPASGSTVGTVMKSTPAAVVSPSSTTNLANL